MRELRRFQPSYCLMQGRERQVLYSLVNCFLSVGDYESGVKCLDLLSCLEEPSHQVGIYKEI